MDRGEYFESLIAELLRLLGYHDIRPSAAFRDMRVHGPDIIVMANGYVELVVEVKAYRPTSPPSLATIRRALLQTANLKQAHSASKALLIATFAFSPGMTAIARGYSDAIEVWDLPVLYAKASPYPHLSRRLALALEMDPAIALPDFAYTETVETSPASGGAKGSVANN